MNAKENLVKDYEDAKLYLQEEFDDGCPECGISHQNWETFEDVLYVECEYCEFTDWVFMEERPAWEKS